MFQFERIAEGWALSFIACLVAQVFFLAEQSTTNKWIKESRLHSLHCCIL